jgi:hypothetical protein
MLLGGSVRKRRNITPFVGSLGQILPQIQTKRITQDRRSDGTQDFDIINGVEENWL